MGQPSEFCMPLLLRTWGLERATGTLTVTAPYPSAIVNIVLVENGAVVFATSRNRRDPTAELFLELFHLPEADPESVDELERIERQVTRVITDMFDWPVAEVSFQDGIHLTRWPRLPLSVADLMLRGMRNVSDSERVRRWVGDPDQIFAHASDPFSIFQLPLKPEEAYFLSRIDGGTTVAELLSGAGLDKDLATRLLSAFLFAGAIEPIPDRAVANPWIGASRPRSGEPRLRPQAAAVDVAEAARFWYLVEEKLRDVEKAKDYYALLEIERRSTPEVIQIKYDELAKTFHPDRYRHLAPGHIDVERHLDTIFEALTTAYIVLTNPKYRDIYDKQLAKTAASQGVRVAPPPSRYATAPLPPKPASAPLPSPPPVQAAPPRPSRPLPPPVPAPVARRTTAPLSPPRPPVEADKTAKEPPKKDDSSSGAPSPAMNLPPDEWFKRGTQFAAANDHERAIQAYERAFAQFADNAPFLVAFGRSLGHVPARRKRAEEILLKAAKLAPLAPLPLLELGMLYAKVGKKTEARSFLERVLQMKPGLAQAEEALKELEHSEKRGSSGLLGKLFRS